MALFLFGEDSAAPTGVRLAGAMLFGWMVNGGRILCAPTTECRNSA